MLSGEWSSMVRRRLVLPSTLVLALTAALAAAVPTQASAAPVADPAATVNTLIGSSNNGETLPGAVVPYGMVQWSPENTNGDQTRTVEPGGYSYDVTRTRGFALTHLSGTGCAGASGDIPFMPIAGNVTSSPSADNTDAIYASNFSHANETGAAGYYRLGLDSGVNVELTATQRTGTGRFTYPEGKPATMLVRTAHSELGSSAATTRIDPATRTISGSVTTGNFCGYINQVGRRSYYTLHFVAEFDQGFTANGTWQDSTVSPGSTASSGGTTWSAGWPVAKRGSGGYVTFDTSTTRSIKVRVGISYVSEANARANLAAENPAGTLFDTVRQQAKDAWNTALGRVQISGGTAAQHTTFYTALYHSLLHPNLAGDVDRKYMGFDRAVHTAADFTPYQNLSLWDTFRPQNQLLEMLEPQVARDVALSILAIGRDGGWLPRWALANSETNIMTGDPITPYLVEAWSKGLLAGHESEAYTLLRRNATSLPPASSPYNGRSGQTYYASRGYVPAGLRVGTDCAHKGGDNDCSHPASATLEYASADAALALMARGLGQTADATMFAQRGQWYRNLWDSSIGHFRPRTTSGAFVTPYNPVDAGHLFHEGGAYQYQWLVPQDPAGLVGIMGGRAAAEQRLDNFFAYPKLLTDPAGTVRKDWIASPYDYYSKPTYNPNNEPDLLAPYMYHWAGRPAKTATVVRAAMTLFTTGPNGMTGNDDLGTMSAWYVFASLGLYPTMSGANFLAVSSPQFPSATVRIGAYGDRQGGTLTVTAPGVADSNRHVQTLRVNGAGTTKSWLTWDAIAKGGTVAHTVGPSISTWGTAVGDEPPSINR
jgi:predicted alpha-1,2-mannosidase